MPEPGRPPLAEISIYFLLYFKMLKLLIRECYLQVHEIIPLKWQFCDEKITSLLIGTDLSQGHHSRLIAILPSSSSSTCLLLTVIGSLFSFFLQAILLLIQNLFYQRYIRKEWLISIHYSNSSQSEWHENCPLINTYILSRYTFVVTS